MVDGALMQLVGKIGLWRLSKLNGRAPRSSSGSTRDTPGNRLDWLYTAPGCTAESARDDKGDSSQELYHPRSESQIEYPC